MTSLSPATAPSPDASRNILLAAQWQAVLGAVQESIQLWDAEGRQAYANPATLILFGTEPGAFAMGHRLPAERGALPCCQCFHEDGRPYTPDELPVARLLSTGQPLSHEILRMVRQDDKESWIRVNGQPLFDDAGVLIGAVTSAADVSDLLQHEHTLRRLAHYDALTHLPNRVLLADRMRQALAHSRRSGDWVAICVLDLDGFKAVNDTLGHKAGDQLLREVAQRLQETIRQDDTAARLGGDEFALLLGGLKKISECEQAQGRILTALAAPYQVMGQIARVSASIGVTLFPTDGSDPDQLLRHADQAMYQAKQAGKNRYQLFDPGHDQRLLANRGTLKKIAHSLAENQFQLHYQPKVDCRRGKVAGVEALLRWHHPVLGILGPSEFIPLIEQDDLIIQLGEWVIDRALKQIAALQAQGLDVRVSVNIAARQLHQKEFPQRLARLVAPYAPELVSRLEVEIVETAALEDVNAVADSIRECRAMGIRVALDDFGTGFSSLVHLKRLAADELKIDQSFIAGMLSNAEDLAIVEGVIGLAGSFRRKVVAEGVETIDQILMLLELGCDVMQGYGLARPMSAERLTDWLHAFTPDPLWNLSSSPRPSRDYFEVLLAEANHRYWIDQHIADAQAAGDRDAAAILENLANPRNCRFGLWYYGEGMRRFRNLAVFREIELIHRDIHFQAEQISLGRLGPAADLPKSEALLQLRHSEMTDCLRRLRATLADEMSESTPTDDVFP